MSYDNKSGGLNFGKLTEEDVKYQYITPAIEDAGWDKSQLKFEFAFTDGKMHIKGQKGYRGAKKRADYLLLYKPSIPIAVVEAKDMNHAFDDGIQQSLGYARTLGIPFAFSSNGKSFMEHNRITGEVKELAMSEFPSPETLWQRYKESKNITPDEENIITEPDYYDPISKKKPRYYQRKAINRTIEAIAQGQNRILLVMATGTGKTFTAFQIAYKLWSTGIKKKILYLADRNILIDQTMVQDFKPFEKVMTKIKQKDLDSSYEIYFSLYQQLVNNENEKQPYQEFSPDFFDLIIVDECHRGSAKEDSQWRRILEYFHSATQIGMTATPKEDKEISTTGYFGEPLYTYSLKQGINDGFLAPYRVKRIGLDVDLDGYRPEKDKVDVNGKLIEDREYNVLDFDRKIIIDDRTKIVAQKVTEYLKRTDRFGKTIVFCVDQEHALRMRRALINENKDLVAENDRYIMRITSDDVEGKKQLDYFIDTDERYPTIVTTSELLSTGVDCKTCKLIVLENNIESMTKFKQIIGRGTRLRPDYGKYYFTIMDFRGSTKKFADPEFDGLPEKDDSDGNGRGGPRGPRGPKEPDEEGLGPGEKYRVNDVKVHAILEKNLCFDAEGNLITENLISFSKDNIINEYHSLDDFIHHWNEMEKKHAITEELYEHNVFLEELREAAGNDDMDDFDLICHIAFDKKPLTRYERVNNVKKRDYLNKYEGVARKVLEGLLDKYATDGITDLESIEFLENDPFRQYGSPMKIAKEFGGKLQLQNALHDLQREIYAD
ncbi:EcoAI/FtnUII family type I restriction enzme subunit R [uncultured Methanobrevibacter sp.]|uniref:EcoAI/FtnUII family type I restriction enzme subunit R n=1 Tax=uncultured Methanobrevibacter sp. TaxID=253161 RepID=UPI00320896AC